METKRQPSKKKTMRAKERTRQKTIVNAHTLIRKKILPATDQSTDRLHII